MRGLQSMSSSLLLLTVTTEFVLTITTDIIVIDFIIIPIDYPLYPVSHVFTSFRLKGWFRVILWYSGESSSLPVSKIRFTDLVST